MKISNTRWSCTWNRDQTVHKAVSGVVGSGRSKGGRSRGSGLQVNWTPGYPGVLEFKDIGCGLIISAYLQSL